MRPETGLAWKNERSGALFERLPWHSDSTDERRDPFEWSLPAEGKDSPRKGDGRGGKAHQREFFFTESLCMSASLEPDPKPRFEATCCGFWRQRLLLVVAKKSMFGFPQALLVAWVGREECSLD